MILTKCTDTTDSPSRGNDFPIDNSPILRILPALFDNLILHTRMARHLALPRSFPAFAGLHQHRRRGTNEGNPLSIPTISLDEIERWLGFTECFGPGQAAWEEEDVCKRGLIFCRELVDGGGIGFDFHTSRASR